MTSDKPMKVTFDHTDHLNSPPWPEWSDSYINNLQWSRQTRRSISAVSFSPNIKAKLASESDEVFEEPGLFDIPDVQVHAWRHPHEIDADISYVIEPDSTPLDLVTHNKHLLHIEIMRKIISSISCLERESFCRPFPIEFQSDQFTANGEAEWKPWHHVYALTAAGKDQKHHPQFNPSGKYFIRLFFLGKWRRILVDDRLPVDSQGQILLPVSRPDNLWLPLLSKALLKVSCLSHGADFGVIHCLTGWIKTVISCKGCSKYQLWCVCCQLMSTTEEIVESPGCCRSDEELTIPQNNQSAVSSRALLAVIASKGSNMLEHTVLISNVRYDRDQASPGWKQYRWNEWAFNKGIITEIPNKPVRNVQIYNPLMENKELSNGDGSRDKNDDWLDFEDFFQNVRAIKVYYKPSYFKYSLRAWSEQELVLPLQTAEDVLFVGKKLSSKDKGEDTKSTKTKKAKIEDPANLSTRSHIKGTNKKINKRKGTEDVTKFKEDWPKNVRKSSFFYLLIDSMASKEVLCCVSGYSPEGPSHAIIFIGRFDWHSPCVAPITTRMSTTATSARFFLLPPGLRVVRIWHQFPAYFCMQIYSNSYFQCGSKMTIQQSLGSDSLSFKFYGREISSRFEQLLAAPHGGAGHGGAYQQLMCSLEPPLLTTRLPWPQWFHVHIELVSAFEECLTEMLVETFHSAADVYQTIQAFQLLFLNPVFGMKTLKSIKPECFKYIVEQNESKQQKGQKEEVKEQTTDGKGVKGKKNDKSKGKPTDRVKTEDKSKSEITEKVDKKKKDKSKLAIEEVSLRKLITCKEKNLLLNDQNKTILLLRKMMSYVPHLRSLYPFHAEDDVKMVLKDYLGETHPVDSWVVLVRCVLNIHSTESVPCSLHIWSPVESLVLRLIDNDTSEEILRHGFVENNVAYLSRNRKGYTVMAYGVTDQLQPIPWRLRSLGVTETECLHICEEDCDRCTNTTTQLPQQHQQTLRGYYVPNKQRDIARCLLAVEADVTVLLRLNVSYKYAVCSLTVYSESGDVVCYTSGTGQAMEVDCRLIGNSVIAESGGSGDGKVRPVVYRISAKLLDNSWPLRPDQLRAMCYYKEHLPSILDKQTGTKENPSRLQSNIASNSEDSDEMFFENVDDKPSWSLTVVTDMLEEVPIKLSLDMTIYEVVNKLKSQWESEGLHLNNCKSLRQEFLKHQEYSDDEITEDTVFKLKPKKLEKLLDLYGQKISDSCLPGQNNNASMSGSSIELSVQTLSSPLTPTPSLGSSSLQTSSEKSGKRLDHTNILVQQSGIHRALQNLREKNLDINKQIFMEAAELREKVINDMITAKNVNIESEPSKVATDKKKGKRSKALSPASIKEKMTKPTKGPKKGKKSNK